ncbi:High mobility group b protein [Thalictrum thalictroides]|uniref:High mobility group b protein n=1 Tax=Thalictrum thalictroides TaxID=46969 RepID=A0A7J6W7Y3_THATH|nr:High mobility group b protein [Thalictrum thalictroides]
MVTEKADASGSSSGKELALLPCSSAVPSSSYPAMSADVAASSKHYVYPQPLAKYEDIVANPKVFMNTLENLHATMRTKFMIPIIGGKELDLHRLFVEVTSRGGIEKVVRERRWKEITSVFKFPSTATNASFILRKYYCSLIHHYEQLYYFRAKGWSRSDPDTLPSPSPTTIPVQGSIAAVPSSSEAQVAAVQQQTKASSSLGSPVVGVIDGKFEHGYLVTVSVGTQKLHGVLYHISDHQNGQALQYPIFNANANNIAKGTAPLAVRRRRRRKKSEMKKRDPAHPKPNRSGYNFFFQEHHARLKPLHPGKDREISKMIGGLWSKLTETEKAVYQEKGVKDKERYQSELQEYRERLKTGQIIGDAVPIQQRHAVPEVARVEVSYQKMEVDEDKLNGKEDESDEEDQMDADSPHTPENGSSLSGSDSEEKTADKDSEMETETSVGVQSKTELSNVAAEDDEVRIKEQKVEPERDVHDLNL